MSTDTPNSSSRLRAETYSPTKHQRPKRRRLGACICCIVSILLVGLIILILALTIFKAKNPLITVNSIQVDGISPTLTFPTANVNLNISLDLDLSVYNPNYASFSHGPGKVFLYYQGTQIGDVDLVAGNIPSRRWERMYCKLTLEADRVTTKLGSLVGDAAAGQVAFDVSTTISGDVILLGFINHRAVVMSNCHVVVGFPDLKVLVQQCTQSVKF